MDSSQINFQAKKEENTPYTYTESEQKALHNRNKITNQSE